MNFKYGKISRYMQNMKFDMKNVVESCTKVSFCITIVTLFAKTAITEAGLEHI